MLDERDEVVAFSFLVLGQRSSPSDVQLILAPPYRR